MYSTFAIPKPMMISLPVKPSRFERGFLARLAPGGLENLPPVAGKTLLLTDFLHFGRHVIGSLAGGVYDEIGPVFEHLLQPLLDDIDGDNRSRPQALGRLNHILSDSANPDDDHVVSHLERRPLCGLKWSGDRVGHDRQFFERDVSPFFYLTKVYRREPECGLQNRRICPCCFRAFSD